MGMEDAAGEKERFIGCSPVQILEIIDGVVGYPRVVILAFRLRKNPPVRLA